MKNLFVIFLCQQNFFVFLFKHKTLFNLTFYCFIKNKTKYKKRKKLINKLKDFIKYFNYNDKIFQNNISF